MCDAYSMKNKNQRDLEKHWAEQARKKTPAEQLRAKAEKLREKMEREQQVSTEEAVAPISGSAATPSPSKPKSAKNSPAAGRDRAK